MKEHRAQAQHWLALPKRRTGVTKTRHFTLQIFQELPVEYANKVRIILKQSLSKQWN
jgi:hypothetical protein